MKAPQVIMIVMLSLAFGIDALKHGEPRKGDHNAVLSLIAIGLQVGLLIWGGFF
jgi:hypothetical protein